MRSHSALIRPDSPFCGSINGKPLGILWKAPVTNLWVNRLIGDHLAEAAQKFTYTAQQFYRADSPLLPSGLIGPVQVLSSANR